jgi:hypothetical protein
MLVRPRVSESEVLAFLFAFALVPQPANKVKQNFQRSADVPRITRLNRETHHLYSFAQQEQLVDFRVMPVQPVRFLGREIGFRPRSPREIAGNSDLPFLPQIPKEAWHFSLDCASVAS